MLDSWIARGDGGEGCNINSDCLLTVYSTGRERGSSKAALSNVREQYDLLFQSRLQIVEACNGVCVWRRWMGK